MKPVFGVLLGVAVVGFTAPVHAGPLADAIARHADKDVAALRAQLPGDATVRCTLGAVYAKRNDLSRAHLYLTDCDDATLPDDIAADVVKLLHETQKKTRASDLAVVELVSNPTGLVVAFDGLPHETITTPATIWIKAGTYTARVTANGRILTNTVVAKEHSRTASIFEAAAAPLTSPTAGKIDFTDEPGGNATGEQHKGAPPNIKHPPLTPDKYRGVTAASGPVIED
ncbi:MAG: hypothetical protein H0T79_03390, partial [Deltaproteobacteria bacterium]|nr:hypothetical protein [Deltaproteobacteria bacterium]